MAWESGFNREYSCRLFTVGGADGFLSGAVLKTVPYAQDNDGVFVQAVAQEIAALTEGNRKLAVFPALDPPADAGLLLQQVGGLPQDGGGTARRCRVMGFDKLAQPDQIAPSGL
jgi:hypothetical protein